MISIVQHQGTATLKSYVYFLRLVRYGATVYHVSVYIYINIYVFLLLLKMFVKYVWFAFIQLNVIYITQCFKTIMPTRFVFSTPVLPVKRT